METLHQTNVKMEEDYALNSDSEPHSSCLASSWNWKSNVENYSISQTPSPQSLSPAASFDSPFSSGSHTQSLDEIPFNNEMMAYNELMMDCQQQIESDNEDLIKRDHGQKVVMITQRRRKASEREKLRMRAIAEAIHTLRNNLPPIYNQGRQPLTKIQTLKCTINYISELTNLLQCTNRA